jgi:hypothetical protein
VPKRQVIRQAELLGPVERIVSSIWPTPRHFQPVLIQRPALVRLGLGETVWLVFHLLPEEQHLHRLHNLEHLRQAVLRRSALQQQPELGMVSPMRPGLRMPVLV